MTNSKKKDTPHKPKIEISRRETSGKKKPDLFAKFRNTEHPLDTIIPIEANDEATLPYPSIVEPALPQHTIAYPTVVESDHLVIAETSPTRNFTKVSNSVVKQAIPEGLFRGQSKHTYDVLYLKTRGAIIPKREIQLTKTELVKATGLEIKTIQRHLSFLKDTGLIKVDPKSGDHKGAIYEIFIPEELALPYPTLPQYGVAEPSIAESSIKPTPDPSIKSTTLGYSKITENKEDTGSPNTSFKTNTNDDNYTRILNEYCIKTTGRKLTEKDKKDFVEVLNILGTEMVKARVRTGGISSFVPFLIAHLKGMIVTPVSRAKKGSDVKQDKVEAASNEINLETELQILRDLIELEPGDPIDKWKDNYTSENWQWLIDNLNG